ncbi:cupin domain-containing protein [Clostridium sp. WLY-B-L2]|jgi:quercetin dioxygenase-like cupin family protein|uniref:Cupin domain-containing protein n=1 Tax=Clostridium aromativorans TaxID=2836848 RepID=A0ABS8N7U3_9CLOT|nr:MULTISPECIES: cupin domain-containing protein [Clostridium]KAA8665195.1 cupin domain-containing protein [Clostridium sp. HV4-5-A1G]MCC9294813.1 cupin domain-containing protein [Clostridium aromativorans]CAB1250781.1 Cupin domain protein [Clostridiaceae bacterium BL-3]
MNSLFKNVEFSKVLNLNDLISYQEGQVISRTIAQISSVNITLFSLDKGEGISTHVTSGDAMVQILDGAAEITIGDNVFNVEAGETIIMPSDIPHGLEARERFKMLLTVIKH